MRFLLHCAILAGAILVAAPVYADTFKWVDDKGVTNYSDSPPSPLASKTQVVTDRVSVVASDPSLRSAIAEFHAQAARQAEIDEADWLQRQRLMLAEEMAYPTPSCPYRADCGTDYAPYASSYYRYYVPVLVAGAARRFHRASTQASFIVSHGRGAHRSGRGALR